jgi:hypothetical protein
MCRGQVAEQPGEPRLRRVVQVVLAAEEDDLVLKERVPDEFHEAGVEVRAHRDAGDFGTDVTGDPSDVDGWRGHAIHPSRRAPSSTSIKTAPV